MTDGDGKLRLLTRTRAGVLKRVVAGRHVDPDNDTIGADRVPSGRQRKVRGSITVVRDRDV